MSSSCHNIWPPKDGLSQGEGDEEDLGPFAPDGNPEHLGVAGSAEEGGEPEGDLGPFKAKRGRKFSSVKAHGKATLPNEGTQGFPGAD